MRSEEVCSFVGVGPAYIRAFTTESQLHLHRAVMKSAHTDGLGLTETASTRTACLCAFAVV